NSADLRIVDAGLDGDDVACDQRLDALAIDVGQFVDLESDTMPGPVDEPPRGLVCGIPLLPWAQRVVTSGPDDVFDKLVYLSSGDTAPSSSSVASGRTVARRIASIPARHASSVAR